MPKMNVRQPRFTCSACEPFTLRGLEWLMEILNIYLEEQLLLKYYVIKHLIFQKIQSMMDIKEVLLQLFTNFFDKKPFSSNTYATCTNKFAGDRVKNENMSEQQLAEELHKPIIRKFEKRNVHSSFIDNIWGVDLASKFIIYNS